MAEARDDLFGHHAAATAPPDGDKGRKERGAFYTPDVLALAICRTLRDDCGVRPRRILEPGCGGGAFLRAAHATWKNASLLGVDLLPACDGPGEVRAQDLFDVGGGFDLVLGNPAFGIAERVVRHALDHQLASRGHLALLLRLTFLGSATRVPLHRAHPLRYLQPIAERPAFVAGGTSDPTEYGLLVWEDGFKGRGELLGPLVWKGGPIAR